MILMITSIRLTIAVGRIPTIRSKVIAIVIAIAGKSIALPVV
jgi:hypothetical protein